ncbi:hypothetical protein [Pontibacter mangrovi]|uniref:Uncharacterized protein n=1 Tax=Pontibacter mangrovi TaxID=2589816 RepID=A0A501WDP0_9BACT|nr:hypothetical protein [Pontibacter mangrovi]TPE43626.1 hypothetical protein FJM65_12785 [Pontibacter mangrovi]
MTFDFYLGGYGRDHSYRIVLQDDNLVVSDYIGIPMPEHNEMVSVVKNEDWDRVVEFLTRCRWKRRYDSGILDGTQFEIKAKGDAINVNSYGSNAYPDDFDEFLTLLNRVVSVAGVEVSKSQSSGEASLIP